MSKNFSLKMYMILNSEHCLNEYMCINEVSLDLCQVTFVPSCDEVRSLV